MIRDYGFKADINKTYLIDAIENMKIEKYLTGMFCLFISCFENFCEFELLSKSIDFNKFKDSFKEFLAKT